MKTYEEVDLFDGDTGNGIVLLEWLWEVAGCRLVKRQQAATGHGCHLIPSIQLFIVRRYRLENEGQDGDLRDTAAQR